MSAATKVSVVMPVYNRERYVREAVESILATGYGNLEIVVVEDGSTDDTPRIVAGLAERNPDVVRAVVHPGHRNLGFHVSVNRAIVEASGDYVCFLDSDDVMLPHRFDAAVPLLDGDPSLDGVVETIDLLFESEEQRRRWGERPTRYGPRAREIAPDAFLEAWLLDRACTILTPNLMVRSRLFRRSGMHRTTGRLSEDHHLRLRMVACGRFAVGEIDRPVARYRRHAGNMWTPDRRDSLRDLEVLLDVWRWARRSSDVPARNADVLEEAWRRKAMWCLSLLREDGDRRGLAGLAARLLAADPRLALDRSFVANVALGLLQMRSGRIRGGSTGGAGE